MAKKSFYQGLSVIAIMMILIVYIMLLRSFCAITRSMDSRPENRRGRIRLVVIFFSMCTLYCVTYLPHAILLPYFDYVNYSPSQYFLDEATGLLYCFTAIVNPLTTLFAKEDYRKLLSHIILRNRLESEATATGSAMSHGTITTTV